MTKEEFYKENDSKFLSLGFRKVTGDPYFNYVLTHPSIDGAELEVDLVGVFHLYINETSVKLSPMSPKKVVKWFYKLLE